VTTLPVLYKIFFGKKADDDSDIESSNS